MKGTLEVNYEQLAEASRRLGAQADEAERVGKLLLQQFESLVQTGWTGQAADAFRREVDDVVMPTVGRLAAALQRSEAVMQQVSQVYREAEEGTLGQAGSGSAGGRQPKAAASSGAPEAAANASPALFTAAQFDKLVKKLDVTRTARYQRDNPKTKLVENATHCNHYVMDFARALGVPMPGYLDFDGDRKAEEGEWMMANQMVKWMRGDFNDQTIRNAPPHGWTKVSAEEAATLASQGNFVVAGWENTVDQGKPEQVHGHVAVVRPDSTPGNILISQAGGDNFESGTLKKGFGKRTSEAEFFVYRKP